LLDIKLTIDVGKAQQKLKQAQDFSFIRKELDASASKIAKIFASKTPVSSDPSDPLRGKLRSGWGNDLRFTGAQGHIFSARIFNKDTRASWLLPLLMKGTKAHIITPRKKGGVLAFHSRKDPANTIFSKFVKHPGTKPSADLKSADAAVDTEVSALKVRIKDLLTH
jgi:hypothetical protein